MNRKRIIARLDIKNEFVIKGIHLEGLRKIGRPNEIANNYYTQGIDEIVFMDAVAAYYDRNSLSDIIEKACENIFVPITVGGGIRTLEDIQNALNSGADKVAINTQAIRNKTFIKEASRAFGSQCIVCSIEAKSIGENKWEAYYDNGRESSSFDVLEWVKELEDLGAGEFMITSIDKEGTKKGFDFDLNNKVSEILKTPVIASGGAGSLDDINTIIKNTEVSAVAVASLLHYNTFSIKEIKSKIEE